MNDKPTFMILAGEISGDMHAAALVEQIAQSIPDASFFGIGGQAMRDQGVDTVYDVDDMAVMGLTEVIHKLFFFGRVLREMTELASTRRPGAIILVDYPGFNMRLAQRTHQLGIKTIFYISPKFWAWNKARMSKMIRDLDRLITIFPFESPYFEGSGLEVSYAGHPLVDEAKQSLSQPLDPLPWKGSPQVAVLPGSRLHEIRRILPIMLDAATITEAHHPDVSFIVAAPSGKVESFVHDTMNAHRRGPKKITAVAGNTHQILRQADAAMVASGTATLDASLMLCPMVIGYKVGLVTAIPAWILLNIKHVGLPNIVAGKEICPELLQCRLTPAAIANALAPLLTDTEQRIQMLRDLKDVNDALGDGGCAARAAQFVIAELGK